MLSSNPIKLFYCHTCKKSSMIDISNLLCPKCSSDFLEEGNMVESGLEMFPRLPDPSVLLRSSESSDHDPLEPSPLGDHNLAAIFRLVRSEHFLGPRENRIRPRVLDENDEVEDRHMGMTLENFLEIIRTNRRNAPPSNEALESIETITISPDMEDTECKICGENFQIDEEAKRLECSHCFHDKCLAPWLEIKNSCPVCRETIE
jgi:Zn finger protein HypA/HybF involved in hydrogenase expression